MIGIELRASAAVAKRVGVTYQSVTITGVGPGGGGQAGGDYHPRRGRSRGRGDGRGGGESVSSVNKGAEGDSVVVSKENWKGLQAKADLARSRRASQSSEMQDEVCHDRRH
jgi:hypothetical protein